MNKPNRGAWCADSIAMMSDLFVNGEPNEKIAEILSDKFKAPFNRYNISGKVKKLGLERKVLTGHSKSFWTAEMAEDVKEYWTNSDLSAPLIAEELTKKYNIKFTNFMVIGKAHRLGLKKKSPPEKPKKPKRPKVERTGGVLNLARKSIKPPVFETVVAPEATPVCEGGITLEDLAPGQCRFPISAFNALKHRFCGDRAREGKPYCEAHMAVAYQPVTRSMAPRPRPTGPHKHGLVPMSKMGRW